MTCSSCGRKRAKHKWDVNVCANPKPMAARLCKSCDRVWNGLVLAFFNHPKRDKLMKDYDQ